MTTTDREVDDLLGHIAAMVEDTWLARLPPRKLTRIVRDEAGHMTHVESSFEAPRDEARQLALRYVQELDELRHES
jgi:hypothetical protein